MLGIFKRNLPYNNFLILIFGVILYLPFFGTPDITKPQITDGYLWAILIKPKWTSGFFAHLFLFLFLLWQGWLINRFASIQRLFPTTHVLVGMCWFLSTSYIYAKLSLSPVCIVVLISLVLLTKLLSLHGQTKVKSELYNIGFLYSIAVLLYSPAIYLAIFIAVVLLILRPVYLAEWFTLFLGALTPYYIMASLLYFFNHSVLLILPRLKFTSPVLFNKWEQNVSVLLIFLLALAGYVCIQLNIRKLLVHAREGWTAVLILLLTSMLMYMFNASNHAEALLLIIAPLTLLMAGLFHYVQKRWINTLLFLVMIGWSFWLGYVYI